MVLNRVVYGCRYVDNIHFRNDVFKKLQGVFQGVAAFNKFVSGNTEGNGNPFTYAGTNGLYDKTGKAGSVFIRSAEFICTLVVQGRKELIEQIRVTAVDFDHVETGTDSTFCRIGVFLNDIQDFLLC